MFSNCYNIEKEKKANNYTHRANQNVLLVV